MSMGAKLAIVIAAFVAILVIVIVMAFRERKLGRTMAADDRSAQEASDARVLTVIFTAILGFEIGRSAVELPDRQNRGAHTLVRVRKGVLEAARKRGRFRACLPDVHAPAQPGQGIPTAAPAIAECRLISHSQFAAHGDRDPDVEG